MRHLNFIITTNLLVNEGKSVCALVIKTNKVVVLLRKLPKYVFEHFLKRLELISEREDLI
jgi:hypothetical protein